MASFILPIEVRQTAATSADATVWAMRKINSASPLYIRRICVAVAFDGAAAATKTLRYKINKTTGVWIPADGSVLAVVKKKTGQASALLADQRKLDTGLDVTGLSFGDDLAVLAVPASVSAHATPYNLDFASSGTASPIELEANEGLAIRLAVDAVIGQGIYGYLEFEE